MAEQKEQTRENREQALRRRKAKKQKELRRRRRILIASLVAIVVAIALIVVLALRSAGPDVEATTFTLNKDGSVTFTEVTDFDSSAYDKADMKKFVKEMVDSYDGSGVVKIDSVKVRGGKAYATLNYDSVATYAEFTGYNVFSGTIDEAKEEGYSFDLTFEEVADGHIGEQVKATDVVSDGERQVLILQENVTVNLPADVKYITTSGIRMVDADTAEVFPVGDNTDAAVAAYFIY